MIKIGISQTLTRLHQRVSQGRGPDDQQDGRTDQETE